MRLQVGTDVGGTFTDLWAVADDGSTVSVKAPSSADIVTGLTAAVDLAADQLGLGTDAFCAAIDRFGHGTTAGLNALLTGAVVDTAVLTTAGFGDTLEIGRMKRQVAGLSHAEIGDYLLRGRWPPIVPRERVVEVSERVDRTGAVLQPLHEPSARAAIEDILDDGVGAIAICTLWSVANPVHELRLAELVHSAAPEVFIALSHRVAPAVGEYARLSTTAVSAMLGPVLGDYIAGLQGALRRRGMRVPVEVMTGAGGVVTAEELVDAPASATFSGPAAAVVSCRAVAEELGHRRVLTIDVGGTSFDAGVIIDGAPLMRGELTLAGADIRLPSVDVATIGAGGGSIASVRNGALKVGPVSAGADPGPACYGRGGLLPTVTDADLLLGVLDPADFTSGGIRLDADAARTAVAAHVAEPLGMSALEAAWGIRTVLDSHMADLLRRVTLERGHDPREFAIYANGGQGPSHAWALALELGIRTVVIPPTATVQSAVGTGTSARRRTSERSAYARIPHGHDARPDVVDRLAGAARQVAAEVVDRLGGDGVRVDVTVAVRFRGQAHHLDVPLEGLLTDPADLAGVLRCFEKDYEALFGAGAAFRSAGFEVLSVRAIGTRELPPVARPAPADPLSPGGRRDVVFDDPHTPIPTAVFHTRVPAAGQRVDGPALVVYPGQTAVIPPGTLATTAGFGDLVLDLSGSTGGGDIRGTR